MGLFDPLGPENGKSAKRFASEGLTSRRQPVHADHCCTRTNRSGPELTRTPGIPLVVIDHLIAGGGPNLDFREFRTRWWWRGTGPKRGFFAG